jgi:cellulose synthase/poly-beta-1,6-N-acetylglucosamine synthase-like glycosyltransferase
MVLFILFLLLFLVQMCFGFFYSFRPTTRVVVKDIKPSIPVSVLVCAKNEAENLKQFLPLILEQNYPDADWELVVVNDGSTDNSEDILQTLCNAYPRLKVHTIPTAQKKSLPGKKYALAAGLKVCQHELVLLTDADCYPASQNWIASMVAVYQQKQAIRSSGKGIFVLGYGSYRSASGILNWFVRWETINTFVQYASWARIGKPYMGVGRNLMYEKTPVLQLLQEASFLAHFSRTASGDDDLIVSALAGKDNVAVAYEPDAHTISIAPATWKTWWRQKTRHVSSGKHYKASIKYGLAAYALSAFLFWILALVLLVSSTIQIQQLTLILIVLKVLFYTFNFLRWNTVLKSQFGTLGYIFGEWLWLLYNFAIAPFIFWKNKQQWK